MRKLKIVFHKKLGVSLTQEEYEQFLKAFAGTTYRSLSEYASKLVTGKPVAVITRDRSYDDFTEAFIEYRKSLENILATGGFSDAEKQWLFGQVQLMQQSINKIYDNVRQAKEHLWDWQGPELQ
jgi:hypothetical protein